MKKLESDVICLTGDCNLFSHKWLLIASRKYVHMHTSIHACSKHADVPHKNYISTVEWPDYVHLIF